jgi:hypothetical protein
MTSQENLLSEALPSASGSTEIARIRGELDAAKRPRWRKILQKFTAAALGSVPWVGGLLSAAATLPDDAAKDHENDLRTEWLEEHHRKLGHLHETISDVTDRFEKLGPEIEDRIESSEYLGIVRKTFRVWDHADTQEKRKYLANLLVNAGGTKLTSDDVVRLFLAWVDSYHESHFKIVREIYQHPGITRYDIWDQIFGELPREDSAEADLYRMLIRDLSTGGVIRQSRATNSAGQFLRKRPARRSGAVPSTMETAFEDTKPYELTELGKQFVHYTMNEVVVRLGAGSS